MIRAERGAVLVVALLSLALLSILAGSWLRVVMAERDAVGREARVIQAEFLAEGAVERVLAWFADPSTFLGPATLNDGGCRPARDSDEVFRKRCVGTAGLPAFTSADGVAQFAGTWDRPNVLYRWDSTTDPLWEIPAPLGNAVPGVSAPAARGEIRILAPAGPDAVATLVSRAVVGADAVVTLRIELMAGPWRGIPGAIHAGEGGPGPFPVRVHWGDIFVEGSVDVEDALNRIPRNRLDAPMNGEPYPVDEPGADRWLEISARGTILGPPRDGAGFAEPYTHLHENQAVPMAGIWSYAALKTYAQRNGRYFTTRGTGLLYPDDREPGLTPAAVLASGTGGEFVFVDTLDRRSPGPDNMETLHVALDHADADAYVGAHIVLAGLDGRSVAVVSPGVEASGPPVAQGVALSRVHYVGALLVAGTVTTRNGVNVFGAVVATGGFVDAGGLELWYDSRLATGYRKGFAPVLVKPGSRRRIISPDAWPS